MKKISFRSLLSAGLVLVLIGCSFQANSQKRTDKKKADGSVVLQYKYLPDNFVNYFSTSNINQDMDINGQSMMVIVKSAVKFGVKALGDTGNDINLRIRIDSMYQNVDTPQGIFGGILPEVAGKEFSMMMTSAGKVTDLTEAAAILISIQGSGESDASETFTDLFPLLPSVPVKPGDTWNIIDTVNIKGKSNTRWTTVNAECKFEGIENLNGVKCAKITSAVTGLMKITTDSQGMLIVTNGDYTATKVLLFAIKDGYFVSESVNTKMSGSLELADQGMSFPVIMDADSKTEIAK